MTPYTIEEVEAALAAYEQRLADCIREVPGRVPSFGAGHLAGLANDIAALRKILTSLKTQAETDAFSAANPL